MSSKYSPIIGLDIKGYSEEKNIDLKKEKRKILKKAIEKAISDNERSITEYLNVVMEGGDGFMATVSANIESVFKVFLSISDKLKKLNEESPDAAIKVRGIIHSGIWEIDNIINDKGETAIGHEIDVAARYLNSNTLRLFLELNEENIDFVFGLSHKAYSDFKQVSMYRNFQDKIGVRKIKVKQYIGEIALYTDDVLYLPEENESMDNLPLAIFHTSMVLSQNKVDILRSLNICQESQIVDFPKITTLEFDNTNWTSGMKENEALIETIIEKSPEQIYIFPLSQIPVLIHFGYLLSDRISNIKIFQFNRDNKKWVGSNKNRVETEKYQFTERGFDKLIVSMSISATIRKEDIKEIIDLDKNSLLELSIKNPTLNSVLYREEVSVVRQYFVDTMVNYGYYKEIHLFYAGPAGLAIELGMLIRKTMSPKVFLYHYENTKTPKYECKIILNG